MFLVNAALAEHYVNKGNKELGDSGYESWNLKAAEFFRKAIKKYPKYCRAYVGLGLLYVRSEQNYSEGIKCLKKAIELKPKDKDTQWSINYYLGQAYVHSEQIIDPNIKAEAIKCYRKVIEIYPEFMLAYIPLVVLLTGNNISEAMKVCVKGLQVCSGYRFYKRCLSYFAGDVFFKMKKYSEAIKYFQESIKLKTYVADTYYYQSYNGLGKVYQTLKNYSESTKCYKKVIEECDDESLKDVICTAISGVGINFYHQKKFSESKKHLEKTIKIDPKHPTPYYYMGIICEEEKNFSKAKLMIEKSVKFFKSEYSAEELLIPEMEILQKKIFELSVKIMEGNYKKKIEKEFEEKMNLKIQKKLKSDDSERRKELKVDQIQSVDVKDFREDHEKTKTRKLLMKDIKKYEIPAIDIELKGKIGAGGYGVCYFAIWKGSGGWVNVVVKEIELIKNETAEQVFSEIAIQLNLNSPAVCRVYGFSFPSPKIVYIVMEKMNYDLNAYIEEKMLNMSKKVEVLKKMTSCIEVLHKKNIMHRDIKCANFLVDKSDNVKVTDFGIATFMKSSKSHIEGKGMGTLFWMAPELFKKKAIYTYSSDIYALGCAFYEVVFEQKPFVDLDLLSELIVVKIGKDLPEKLENPPNNVEKEIIDLLKKCLDGDPQKRPTAFDLLVWFENNEKKI